MKLNSDGVIKQKLFWGKEGIDIAHDIALQNGKVLLVGENQTSLYPSRFAFTVWSVGSEITSLLAQPVLNGTSSDTSAASFYAKKGIIWMTGFGNGKVILAKFPKFDEN